MIEHLMMFATFKEQRHFIYPSPEEYNGVVFNASMVTHAGAGLAAFLLTKTPGLAYIIDPMTHAFQHDPKYISKDKNGEQVVKRPIEILAAQLGPPFSNIVGAALLPKHFEKVDSNEVVVACLNFQRSELRTRMEEHEAIKYFGPEEQNFAVLSPRALVAPYFYLTEATYREWINLSVEFARIAKTQINGEKIFASIVISKGLLTDAKLRRELVENVADLGLDGFLIWVDSFDEHTASGSELSALQELVRGLRTSGAQVINLHGGYFSIAASGADKDQMFTGVTHGPEFGESRAVVPVGGGIPISKYYVPGLHRRIRFQDAVNLFIKKGWLNSADAFHSNVCDCDECILTLAGNPDNFYLFGETNVKDVQRGHSLVRLSYPTTESSQRCLRHYLQCKSREFAFANENSEKEILEELKISAEKHEDVMGLDGVGHLRMWHEAIKGS